MAKLKSVNDSGKEWKERNKAGNRRKEGKNIVGKQMRRNEREHRTEMENERLRGRRTLTCQEGSWIFFVLVMDLRYNGLNNTRRSFTLATDQ